MPLAPLFGRTKITAKYEDFTVDNAVEQLTAALSVHRRNAAQIRFLYDYYRGNTPILKKHKEYRQEVNNRVGVALAQEVISFYTGYLVGKPITYSQHDAKADRTEEVNTLNDWCRMAQKATCDIDIANWAFICGTAYRSVSEEIAHPDETPFAISALDPRETFVAYSAINSNTPIFACNHRKDANGKDVYVMYSNGIYVVSDGKTVTDSGANIIGNIPIIEYPANSMRIGAFEPCIPILNALETIQSSRVDAVQQEADSVLAIIGCNNGDDDEEIEEMAGQLQKLKMLVLPVGSDAKYVSAPMRQNEIQTLEDSLQATFLAITGLPNRHGGGSSSDTGAAVTLRDGWTDCETRARQFEGRFKDAEVLFLRCAMSIARIQGKPFLPVRDIEPKFPTRNNDNVLLRSQALQTLLASGIGTEDALTMVSIVSDPTDVALRNRDRVDKLLFKTDDNEDSNSADKNDQYGVNASQMS